MSSVSFVLDVVAIERSSDPDSPLEIDCAGCGGPLDVHQPEPATPERLLATCGECGAWYLIEPTPGGRPCYPAACPAAPSCRPPGNPRGTAPARASIGRTRGGAKKTRNKCRRLLLSSVNSIDFGLSHHFVHDGRDATSKARRLAMPAFPPTTISVRLEATAARWPAERATEFSCRRCNKDLDLQQPDPSSPDHLLGVCPGCGAWHSVAFLPGGDGVLVTYLAIADLIQNCLIAPDSQCAGVA